MKAQRYTTIASDDEFTEAAEGEWMLSDDGDKLEAENKSLKAEVEALKATQVKVNKRSLAEGQENRELRHKEIELQLQLAGHATVIEDYRQKVADSEWEWREFPKIAYWFDSTNNNGTNWKRLREAHIISDTARKASDS